MLHSRQGVIGCCQYTSAYSLCSYAKDCLKLLFQESSSFCCYKMPRSRNPVARMPGKYIPRKHVLYGIAGSNPRQGEGSPRLSVHLLPSILNNRGRL